MTRPGQPDPHAEPTSPEPLDPASSEPADAPAGAVRERFTGGRLTSPGIKPKTGLTYSERAGWLVALAVLAAAVAAFFLIRNKVWFALRFGDGAEREAAAVRLADDPEGVDTLLALAADSETDVRRAAVVSLGRHADVSTQAVDGLIRATEDNASSVRKAAVRALASAAPSPRAAAALRRVLSGPDPALHVPAAEALAHFGGESADAVPALIAMSLSHQRKLGSPGDAAGATLDTLGPAALPGLVAATRHVSRDVRHEALRRLEALAGRDTSAQDALADTAKSPFADVRAAATVATARRDGITPAVLMELALLFDKPETHGTAITGLREAAKTGLATGLDDAQAAVVVPRLLALGGEDDVDRRAAVTLLKAIGPPSVGPLVDAVRRAVEPERRRALMALSQLGPARWAQNDKGESLALLEAELMADRDPELVATALVARGAEGMPGLIQGVQNGRRPVRLAALDALTRLPPTETGLDAITGVVAGGGLPAERAVAALAALGAQGAQRMAQLLSHKDTGARRLAARALTRDRPAPRPGRAELPVFVLPESAIPALLQAAKSRDAAVRAAALGQLVRFPSSPEAVAAVERGARDSSPWVRRALRAARGTP